MLDMCGASVFMATCLYMWCGAGGILRERDTRPVERVEVTLGVRHAIHVEFLRMHPGELFGEESGTFAGHEVEAAAEDVRRQEEARHEEEHARCRSVEGEKGEEVKRASGRGGREEGQAEQR